MKTAEVVTLPEWKQLFIYLRDMDYGTEFTHDEFSKIMGIPCKTQRYYNAVGRCTRELWTEQKHIENIKDKGYRIVMPNEHLRHSTKKVKQAARRFRDGVLVSGATNEKMLNDEERRHLDDHNARLVRVGRSFDKGWLNAKDTVKLAVTPPTDRMVANGEKE